MTEEVPAVTGAFRPPPRAARMRTFGGPSVWLEASPLSALLSTVNLGQGSPAWDPPPFVTAALRSAVASSAGAQYARPNGAASLLHKLLAQYAPLLTPSQSSPSPQPSQCPSSLPSPVSSSSPQLDALQNIIVTNGVSGAISLACTAFLSPNDTAVLLEPAFDMYSGAIRLAGATPVYVPLLPPRDAPLTHSSQLRIDLDRFAAALSTNTRLVFLNSPHNPTGKVFSREEYVQIARLIDERAPSCLVLCDDIYEHMIYDGHQHVPFASVSESAFRRTLSAFGAGKTFSATGLKVGWIIAHHTLIRELSLAQQYGVFSVNHPSQLAIAASLDEAKQTFHGFDNYYAWLRAKYVRNRDILVDALRAAGLQPIVPQGSFFVCALVPDDHPVAKQRGLPQVIKQFVDDGKLQIDQSTVDRSDYNMARRLAIDYGVSTVPVSAFYAPDSISENNVLSTKCLRFAFCQSTEQLHQAARQLLKPTK